MADLSSLISKLKSQTSESGRAVSASKSSTSSRDNSTPVHGTTGNVLFLGTYEDESYTWLLKGMFNGHAVYTVYRGIESLAHLRMYCTQRHVDKVVSTDTRILRQLLEKEGGVVRGNSLDNYAGSLFDFDGVEVVFINPVKQCQTVPHGAWITRIYISKVVAKNSWAESTEFKWTLAETGNLEGLYNEFSHAYAISVDIETVRENLAIRCVGYTGIFISDSGSLRTHSIVMPMDSEFNLEYVRKFNALPIQKITQRGKYDHSYLLRYNVPCANWLWDTANQFHSWYSELPKDLAFLNAFFLRKVVYWKDLAETSDTLEYYRYNALDTWATANVWIQWMLRAPDWARRNYTLEFPLNYPCLLAEMTGIERDMERLQSARKQVDEEEEPLVRDLRTYTSERYFNPGSSDQTKTLLAILGCGDIDSSNEKDLQKAMIRHPLNNHILSKLIRVRELRKSKTNYLRLESDRDKGKDNGAKELRGRILYAINPDGTKSARCASKEHHFWCGLQIQNITTGPSIKQTLRASSGFFLAECDLEQAESRDTAYISGDTALIRAVESDRDFHSVNCSAFFGIPYDKIYDDVRRKTLDKKLRDLSKRVNHGANYNMGWSVLIDTMGLDKIWEAGRILRLPSKDPRFIAEYLLACFHKTYPKIKDDYYASVVHEVSTTSMLVSRAFHHTEYNLKTYEPGQYIELGDWTRFTFGRPDKSKPDLNSLISHCPQSLNARTLNEAFMMVFYEIALSNPETFRLHAQIHDSILFSYHPSRPDHCDRVRELMEIPVTIRDVSGIVRTFVVPAAVKKGKVLEADGSAGLATYWSETE